ncbi:MAG: glycosyltransferase family 2 protein [bacterium]|nr:glycosyltransferase family 2 protein [bacterium]MCM1374934.1 glycosyltransferase family 2 protein [Muribaculum sp.]
MADIDYQEAYEREKERCAQLADKLSQLELERDMLRDNLNFIHNSVFWKLSKPVRKVIHFFIRQCARIRRVLHPRDLIRKLKYKRRERLASRQFGMASFPDQETIRTQREAVFSNRVKFSILVPLWNTPQQFLTDMISSVMNQTYANWELCLADGSDDEHSYVEMLCQKYVEEAGGRIIYHRLDKNEGIAGNTNQCYAYATGDYIGLLDHDDVLHPCALYEYARVINETGADFIYCDEATFKNGSIDRLVNLHFKPDYAPDTLCGNNYICHFSVFSRHLLEEDAELFRTSLDGSQDHDMILRLTARAQRVYHVPKLLYYWRSHEGSVASDIEAKPYAVEAAKRAVSDHLERQGFSHFQISSTRAFPTIFRIRYQVEGNPRVSVIIPNNEHREELKRCVGSILERSTYDNYELVIVENGSASQEIKEYYSELLGYDYEQALRDGKAERRSTDSRDGGCLTKKSSGAGEAPVKIAIYNDGFNYSAVSNLGEKYADGDYVLLLNNDTQVITFCWIEELLMYAQREDVGAVGAKLYYGNHTIQHAGVVIGMGAHGTAGHSHYQLGYQDLGYMGRLCYAQNVSAVTGACLMVRRSLYEQVEGLDESFAVSLNDVDFCLRLRELGKLNIFTPFAELYHYESESRGDDVHGENALRYDEEAARFRERWKTLLEQGDPYFNPNFTLERSDYQLKLPDSDR